MEIIIRNTRTMLDVAEAAAMTQGIAVKVPSVETWARWLNSEHSMIRRFGIQIKLIGVPYYVHVHLTRHKIGCEWYVRSQRPTAINAVGYDRRKAPQDAPVDLIADVNPQSMMDISQVRLCQKADEVTRDVWTAITAHVIGHSDPYIREIGRVMVPRCMYRGGVCHELKPCGLYPHYLAAL